MIYGLSKFRIKVPRLFYTKYFEEIHLSLCRPVHVFNGRGASAHHLLVSILVAFQPGHSGVV